MKNIWDLIVKFFLGAIIVIPAFTLAYLYEKNYGCPGRAESQGLKAEYGPIQGCVFQLPDGRKVNEKYYRVF